MPEIDKTYEPAAVEAKWYAFWLERGCFTADPARVSEKRPAYSIVIPPPNVTGVLTLGHVLNASIQDILARRARMQGKEVLWLPGTDHAGIATQSVVEKSLRKAGEMKHRDDLGREALVAKIWEWQEKYGGIILQQLRALGASCDWSRTRFTMDADYSRCVQSVFVDLFRKGLIYRGKRMVNWCPASLTALSDEEVIMKEQQGTLYYFKVEVVEQPGRFLTIATTRPETIPGDTALAVNPKDPRYTDLVGRHVRRPLPRENQALIPIIADDHVTFDFGTGVLKVTPAHDKADHEIGQRHNLPIIDILHPNGVLNDLAGADLAGLERFAGRARAAELLGELGLLEKEEPYRNSVGYSERADVPIEPRLSEQWFLKYPSVEEARAGVEVSGGAPAGQSLGKTLGDNPDLLGKIRFHPERWAKVYDHWLGGLQDWCISRQLWWGHRIPVWYRRENAPVQPEMGTGFAELAPAPASDPLAASVNIPTGPQGISAASSGSPGMSGNATGALGNEAPAQKAPPALPNAPNSVSGSAHSGSETLNSVWGASHSDNSGHFPEGSVDPIQTSDLYVGPVPPADLENWTQDPDVLDTWFSSWLWPFATMGWPEKTDTLRAFYPTSDLVTAPDILFFWVARMIMAGLEWMGTIPFQNVYFTSLIRDKQGRKLSKSLGNSPDPLDLIAQYGADGLRFGTMRSAPLGQDVTYDEKNVELGRNFCTKLWNAARFRQMQGGESEGEINPALLTSDDKWLLLRLDRAIREVSTALDEYRFSDAAQTLYRFFWSEYCDWYLEASKAVLNGNDAPRQANALAVIDFVLAHALRLFHPFMPFITEELWHGLGYQEDLPAAQGGETIMFARWPEPLDEDFRTHYGLDASDEQFATAKYEVVNLGRGLRRDFHIASSKRVRFVFSPHAPLPAHEAEVLRILLNAEPLEVLAEYAAPAGTPTALTPLGTLYLPLEGLVDVAAERERLGKERTKAEEELAKVRAKLGDANFTSKVPAKVLEEHRQREAAWSEKSAQLAKMLAALGG